VRPFRRCEIFLLVDELHGGRDEAGALDLQRLIVDLQEQIELGLQRHFERILRDRRVPRCVEGFNRRKTHRFCVDLPVGARDLGCLRRDPCNLVLRHDAAAGKSPGAVDDYSHAEAVVLGVGKTLDSAVAGEDELVAVPIDADVGVRRPGLLRGGERGIS
jgi:hypothetical protein